MIEPAVAAYSGLLVLDKPRGCTSYDCVHIVKRLTGEKRVGHCGTLDPLAEGVLLVLLGRATKSQDSFLGLEKEYRFQARFGVRSETGDSDCKEIQKVPFEGVSQQALVEVMRALTGAQLQQPPRYAALKYKGKPYYKWARKGIEVPRPARSIEIRAFDLLRLEHDVWEGRVVCSRGTYIRSLVEDVAAKLGTGALIESLVRERIGPYVRQTALSRQQLLTMPKEELLQNGETAFRHHTRNV